MTTIAYLEAYACDESGDDPQYAQFVVTPEFLKRLLELQSLTNDYDLASVSVYMSPDSWGGKDFDSSFRSTVPELVVSKSDFWFEDYPKHATYKVETRAVDISEFIQGVESSSEDKIFFGSSIDDLKEYVLGVEEEAVE